MKADSGITDKWVNIIGGIFVLFGLYITSLYSYLLFHSLSEIFSIAVACGIFMVAWNSRRFLDNNYLLFLGVAYLFIGGIDLIHTLAYKGMGIFQGYDANLPTQLWISSRVSGESHLNYCLTGAEAKNECQIYDLELLSSHYAPVHIDFLLENLPGLLCGGHRTDSIQKGERICDRFVSHLRHRSSLSETRCV